MQIDIPSLSEQGADQQPRQTATKRLILEVAERLFGMHGFDGTSLREIAAAAGQRNFNAVQYHFGSKKGLITAVLRARYLQIDDIRDDSIARWYGDRTLSELSTRELLKLLWEPAYTLTSKDESAAYCRFQLQYRLNPHKADHPFYEVDQDATPIEKATDDTRSSSMGDIARALRAKFPELDAASFYKRTAAIDYMFLCSMVERSNLLKTQKKSLSMGFDDLLNMMTAAMLEVSRS